MLSIVDVEGIHFFVKYFLLPYSSPPPPPFPNNNNNNNNENISH